MAGELNGFNRRKADARLVAAAPSLYAICFALRSSWGR